MTKKQVKADSPKVVPANVYTGFTVHATGRATISAAFDDDGDLRLTQGDNTILVPPAALLRFRYAVFDLNEVTV